MARQVAEAKRLAAASMANKAVQQNPYLVNNVVSTFHVLPIDTLLSPFRQLGRKRCHLRQHLWEVDSKLLFILFYWTQHLWPHNPTNIVTNLCSQSLHQSR